MRMGTRENECSSSEDENTILVRSPYFVFVHFIICKAAPSKPPSSVSYSPASIRHAATSFFPVWISLLRCFFNVSVIELLLSTKAVEVKIAYN